MAETLNQFNSDIESGDIIQPQHITQFADALTGNVAYNIAASGSLAMTGPSTFIGSIKLNGSDIESSLSELSAADTALQVSIDMALVLGLD